MFPKLLAWVIVISVWWWKSRSCMLIPTPRIALFIDADHVGPRAFEPIIGALESKGDVVLRRIYAIPSDAALWASSLAQYNINQRNVPRRRGGTKDMVDLSMALDVAGLISDSLDSGDQELRCDNVSAVAIATDDIDYMHILQRAIAWGKSAYFVTTSQGIDSNPAIDDLIRMTGVEIVPYSIEAENKKDFQILIDGDERLVAPL